MVVKTEEVQTIILSYKSFKCWIATPFLAVGRGPHLPSRGSCNKRIWSIKKIEKSGGELHYALEHYSEIEDDKSNLIFA